ncbi:cytochrome ubiquinol oxidase subunit I [Nonomuraea muscovyensis]|uniref:Uncharacterized protein n=1 Tax=Nonomuraea muscovyensis TaxID=1124761 RepID=A0A7X0C943_9ACTN|nr:cytochrome ubiquinol oxidase subunit I [Nonomuraea muscovyensis]MBB6348974.1 hypothetical protein [Nonomuraea muscovyensis]
MIADILTTTPGADLVAARMQMALSLGWHIVLACFGVGMPAITLLAEWRGHRTGDNHYRLLARRWARAMGVLFAVGAVSGTILSFETPAWRCGSPRRWPSRGCCGAGASASTPSCCPG